MADLSWEAAFGCAIEVKVTAPVAFAVWEGIGSSACHSDARAVVLATGCVKESVIETLKDDVDAVKAEAEADYGYLCL
jgi:hypothetical protein